MDLRLFTPQQFELLCARLLQAEGFELQRHSGRSRDVGIDFITSTPDEKTWVVEVKHWQRTAMSSARFRGEVYQLAATRKFLDADAGLLIVSISIPAKALELIKVDDALHIWDEAKIRQLLEKHPDVCDEFFSLISARAITGEKRAEIEIKDVRAKELIERLESLNTGEDFWREYEDLGVEILNHAFIPPLRTPNIQSRSEDGLDRRDAIYSIGHGHTFWDNLKSECRTRFVVAEFKNYTHAPAQKEVESIQQYLFTKAMRSFGLLCCRNAPSDSALKARRRAWLEFDKLIIILSDDDLKDILKAKEAGEDASEILDAQLNEFFTILCP